MRHPFTSSFRASGSFQSSLALCALALFLGSGSGCGSSGASADANPGEGCTNGVTECQGGDFVACVDGQLVLQEACDNACDSQLGCTFCEPGTSTCTGEIASVCNAAGTDYEDFLCDSVQGNSCDEGSGQCVGACSPQSLGNSYIGCEYFPTVTANEVSNDFAFAVAIANASNVAASVTIEGGAEAAPINITVPPQSVQVQPLAWVPDLKAANCNSPFGCGGTTSTGTLSVNGAYHLRSTSPITVYQFSALDYQQGANFSYTNDASLLLPSNVLGTDYVVAAWPHWQNGFPGLTAVTAVENNTEITMVSSVDTASGTGSPAFSRGVPQTVSLNRGDVLQVLTTSGDLTGSRITSNRPIQVIGGHLCTNVPINVVACDHLEESLFPVQAMGNRYAVSSAALPAIPEGKARIIRIVATEPDTTLSYDPPQAGAPTSIALGGEFIQIENNAANFLIESNKKILVAEYMTGQDAGGGAGDPAFTLAVPSEQYRIDYLFHAPTNYASNYVNVVAETGTTVTLDGAAIPAASFSPAGGEFSVAKVLLDNSGDGNHRIESATAFGITVYGYGDYTSYWYAGGLDLEKLVVE